MADDERHLGTAGASEDGDSLVAGIPGFYGDPGVHFSIDVDDISLVVDCDAGVEGLAERIWFHDTEATPDFVG